MVDADRKRFAMLLAGASELYDRAVSESLATMYFDALVMYDIVDLEAAFTAHARDPDRGRFFPKIADLIDKLEGSAAERASLAWSEVIRLASNSREARSDDPAVRAAVRDLGGWVALGRMSPRELSFAEPTFARLYNAHVKRNERQRLTPPLRVAGLLASSDDER